MKMLPRLPSAALPRKLAYTHRAQYTHPLLSPLFRRASTPITEVIDDQVPHQTDGTLMRGVEGRAAVVLGRLPSPWRGECISRLALSKYPSQQLDRVVDTCIIEARHSREGEAGRELPALFCFASSSRPAKWRSSVIAPSSTFPACSCDYPATCRSCHVTGDSWYVSECSGDALLPALVLKTMQNDLGMH